MGSNPSLRRTSFPTVLVNPCVRHPVASDLPVPREHDGANAIDGVSLSRESALLAYISRG